MSDSYVFVNNKWISADVGWFPHLLNALWCYIYIYIYIYIKIGASLPSHVASADNSIASSDLSSVFSLFGLSQEKPVVCPLCLMQKKMMVLIRISDCFFMWGLTFPRFIEAYHKLLAPQKLSCLGSWVEGQRPCSMFWEISGGHYHYWLVMRLFFFSGQVTLPFILHNLVKQTIALYIILFSMLHLRQVLGQMLDNHTLCLKVSLCH